MGRGKAEDADRGGEDVLETGEVEDTDRVGEDVPWTLLAPWVRGVCDGGDGGGNSPTPSWVRAGEDVRGDGEFTPLIRPGVGTGVGEDGGPVVAASRSALPSKRGSSLPWLRGSSLPW